MILTNGTTDDAIVDLSSGPYLSARNYSLLGRIVIQKQAIGDPIPIHPLTLPIKS